MRRLDTDGDGYVTFAEFAENAAPLLAPSRVEARDEISPRSEFDLRSARARASTRHPPGGLARGTAPRIQSF